jgi:hypothetical protein
MPQSSGMQRTQVTLEILQKSPAENDQVLLGTFSFSTERASPWSFQGKTGEAEAFAVASAPFGLGWDEHDGSTNRVKILRDNDLKLERFERALDSARKVRSAGGPKFQAEPYNYVQNRLGYQVAPGDKEIDDLRGKAGVTNDDRILSVLLTFDGLSDTDWLPFVFPADLGEDQAHGEMSVSLHSRIKWGGNTTEQEGPAFALPAHPFTQEQGLDEADLKEALKEEYGDPSKDPPLHARDYVKYFDQSKRVGAQLVQEVGTVTDFLSSKVAGEAGYALTRSEIAVSFLSEGAVLVISEALRSGANPDSLLFNGYKHLGIDSFVTAWKNNEGAVRNFTAKSLQDLIAGGRSIQTVTNEAGDTFETFSDLGLQDAIYAVGCLYANCKDRFSRDLSDDDVMGNWGMKVKDMPLHVQFFWTTLYYNTGVGKARNTLRNQGLEYHDLIWTRADSHSQYAGYDKYNANWRTATFRLLDRHGGL